MSNFYCPRCPKGFATYNDMRNHANGRHKLKIPVKRPDDWDEPSLADIAIEATIKKATGEPLDPLEESLLP